MARRTLYLPVLIAAAVAVATSLAVALSAVSQKAEATFPGKNGRIAYASYEGGYAVGHDVEIYTIRADGSGKRQLTHNDRDDIDPAYSPDGKKIVYAGVVGPKGNYELYTIKPSGRDKVRVTHNDADEAWPTYSPSGNRMAYTDMTINEPGPNIHAMKAGGGGQRLLARNGAVPSYSPDGKRIAYECYGSLLRIDTDICTIGVRGGDKVHVTNNDTDDFNPDYSPDGERIAYMGFEGRIHKKQDEDASANIYTIKVGGGGSVNLTKSPKYDALWNDLPSYSRRQEDRLHGSRRRDPHDEGGRGREVPTHQQRCVPPEALLG